MSVNNQNNNLRTDIKNFIDLLQNSTKFTCRQKKISYDSDRLSIIYSASEPESVLADKSSDHHSGESDSSILTLVEQELFKQITKYGLSPQLAKAVKRVEQYVCELKKCIKTHQQKQKTLTQQFEGQKNTTDQILKALIRMDESEHEIFKKYQNLSNKYHKIQEDYENLKQQNKLLQNKIVENSQDIDFMKKLVFVANQNYEKLEKKCQFLQNRNHMLSNFKQQKSSPEMTNRSSIRLKKSSLSPSISQKLNIPAHRMEFDENYRKYLAKTLRNKII